MIFLVKRNIMLYFRNRSTVFFSILGALLSFFLYLIFLKNSMLQQWAQVPQGNQLLDLWLIGGTMAVAAITSTLTGLSQLVEDRETHVSMDIALVGLSQLKQDLSYIISSALIGCIMQNILFLIMMAFFAIVDQVAVPWRSVPLILLTTIYSSLTMGLLNFIFVKAVQKKTTLGKIETIVGTASGFFVGVYTPIGILPTFAQGIVKLHPGIYLASLYRRLLLTNFSQGLPGISAKKLNDYQKFLGVGIQWKNVTSSLQEYAILLVTAIVSLLVLSLIIKGQSKNKSIKLG